MGGNRGSGQYRAVVDGQFLCLEIGASKVSVLWGGSEPLRVFGVRSVPQEGIAAGGSCSLSLSETGGGSALGLPPAEHLVPVVRQLLAEANSAQPAGNRSVLATSACLDVRVHDHEVTLELGGRAVNREDVMNLHRLAGEWGPARGERVLWSRLCDFCFEPADNPVAVADPVGHSAERLSARVVVVSAPEQQIRVLGELLAMAGCERVDFVACPVASAYAVTRGPERQQGVVVVDLGAQHTQLAAFDAGHLLHASALPIGVSRVAEVLSRELSVSVAEATALVRKQACSLRWMCDAQGQVVLSDGRRVASRTASDIVAQALSEIFEPLAERLRPLDRRWAGSPSCVITGGGSALPTLVEYGEEMLRMPVRTGRPWLEQGSPGQELGSEFAALVGLLRTGPPFVSTRAIRHSWTSGLRPESG